MLRNSNLTIFILALVASVALHAPAFAGGGKVAVTPERAKICAKAEARYKDLFPDAPNDGATVVLLYKYNFCPANVTVKKGTTVRWVNVDKRTSHSVWLKDAGKDESERFFPDESWSFPFQATGDYPYLCGPHWDAEGMTGFVRVTD